MRSWYICDMYDVRSGWHYAVLQYIPRIMHTVDILLFFSKINSGVLCQKQVSMAGTSNYILQILWDVITCPCPWYLLLEQLSRAGTRNYIPQILWDVITCPYPWYLLLAQVSRAGTRNYIPQILWDVIMCPCPWYLPLTQHSSISPIPTGLIYWHLSSHIEWYGWIFLIRPQYNQKYHRLKTKNSMHIPWGILYIVLLVCWCMYLDDLAAYM